MDLHHLVEAAGVLAIGVLFYSFTLGRLRDGRRRKLRHVLNGLVFGALAVWLAIARIQIAPEVFFDARSVPVALIALFEGWTAGLLAAGMVVVYRWWWLGGPGTLPGIVSVLCVAVVGGLVHWWATRRGRVGGRHAYALGAATFLATLLGYAMLGREGFDKFASTWAHFLVAYVGGVGFLAPLLQNVVERERLAAAERRFRALLDEASEAIRIVDPETRRILETNRADSVLTGCPRERLLARDSREFWPEDPEDRARWEELVTETAATGAASAFGLPYRPAVGPARSVDLTVRRVEHDGRPYEIVMLRDAGPREALDTARREVLDLRAVTLVANAAAHEINNPLTVIVGSLELLQRRLGADQEVRWIDRAMGSSQRIREIIGRMTRITRVESARSIPGVPAMLDIHRSSEDNRPR
ncbi:MAG TPA: LytS/YhcK type 5TM receptor domain-containing protein [Methylomirabilota bacterium]|nr:LytS/YhcK type 5TM receptor domain-containing protein [Methylomirabilota bacterium]